MKKQNIFSAEFVDTEKFKVSVWKDGLAIFREFYFFVQTPNKDLQNTSKKEFRNF